MYMLKRIKWISTILFSIVLPTLSYANEPWNMPYGVTPISHKIYELHMITFYICVAIGVLVFGMMIYTLINHRRSKHKTPAVFHEHPVVEILWTIIPFFILVGLAIPSTYVLSDIHNTDKAELNIKITGYQWKWKYDYLDQGISYFSTISTPQEQ